MWFSNNIYLNAATGTADNIPEERGMNMTYQVYRIDQYDCKRILMRFKDISKEKFLWHCKDKGHITYGGFDMFIMQPGEYIECFDGNQWCDMETEWSAKWMRDNVFSLMR